MEKTTVPGLSNESMRICTQLVERELQKVNREISAAASMEGRHRPLGGQWFADMRKRRNRLITAQDELRRINQAYRELRLQRESNST